MIRIAKITPLGEKGGKPLKDIEAEYLRRVGLYYRPLTSINHSIANNSLYLVTTRKGNIQLLNRNLTLAEITLMRYISANYQDVITGNPKKLQAIIDDQVMPQMFGRIVRGRFRSNEFGKALVEIFGYHGSFRSQKTKGKWFAQQLNIKSCPYCNSQYTLSIHDNSKNIATKFQFDHFFSKTRYPFLSISMYNLIPSCASCNLSKGNLITNIITHYNPYHTSIAARSKFKLMYKPDVKKISIGDISGLDLKIDYKHKLKQQRAFVKEHNEIFDIVNIYQRHQDIVEDLLYKAVIYNSNFKKDIMKIKNLFNKNDRMYQRYLIGNYSKKEEISKRPLAKFTQDIARQLKLIR